MIDLKKILKAIGNFLSGAAKKISEALSTGNKVANIIKTVLDSPLIDVAVNLTATDIDNRALDYIRPRLAKWLETIGWAQKKISDFDQTTLPHVMNSLNAEISKLKADYEGVDLPREKAIASAQVVYNPEIVNV